MEDFKTLLDQIKNERGNLDRQERVLLSLQMRQQRGETITAADLQTAASQLAAAKAQLQNQIEILHQGQTLDSLVSNWDAEVPLLMLPVRLQTRIRPRPGPTQGDYFELLVRIYPDDIYACSHEDVLTDREVAAGKNYWEAIRLAEQPSVTADLKAIKMKDAWRELCAQFGGGRSLYIARVTAPLNRSVLGKLASQEEMQFNQAAWKETKNTSWAKAAKTPILPDRFQVQIFKSAEPNSAPQLIQNGNLIPDTLQLGLDPLNESGHFTKKAGEIRVGDEIKWMTDFAEAERVGMGIRVPLPVSFYLPSQTPVAPSQPQGQVLYLSQIGIPRIVVVGVLTSADKTTSADFLQKTFENHLYTTKGFSFLKKGTPTNNTDDNNSAWSVYNDPVGTDFVDGFKSFADNDETCDGARMAKAFGIPKATFQTAPNAGKKDVETARQMNKALYPATVGYYFDELLRGIDLNRTELQAFFQKYVIGGGSYSAFRVGNQPYGVVLTGGASNDSLFQQNLNRILSQLFAAVWLPLSNQVSRVGTGNDPAQTLVDILSLHAQSVDLGQQWFNPIDPMMANKISTFDADKTRSNTLIANFLLSLGYSKPSVELALSQKSAAEARLAAAQAPIPALTAAAAAADRSVAKLENELELLRENPPDSEPDQLPNRPRLPKPGSNLDAWLRQIALKERQLNQAKANAEVAHANLNNGRAAVSQASADVQTAERKVIELMTTNLGSLLNYSNQPIINLPADNIVGPVAYEEGAPLTGATSLNYLNWLAKLTSIRDLEILPFGTRADMASLLFLMVRHGFLHLFSQAFEQLSSLPVFKASETTIAADMTTKMDALRKATSFNISAKSPPATLWEIFQTVIALDDAAGSVTAPFAAQFAGKPLSEVLLSPPAMNKIIVHFRTSADPLVLDALRPIQTFLEFRDSLTYLSRLSAEELEQALMSHLDCSSYRLDAWMEGAIARRLEQQRSKKPDGIYLGAFGWVENLKLGTAAQQTEGGFIHAPSPTHATAAAVMKSAFLNHKKANRSAFAVNLSSRRLQRAQEILERLRGNERLEAVLGYQFERELQDASNNQSNASAAFITAFRQKYPITAAQIAPAPDSAVVESRSFQNIVNGLKLAEEFFLNAGGWKANIAVPPNSPAESSIQKAIANLADTLDALKDLLSAETAYRMAQGNFDAVGAAFDALAQGALPQELGFTEAARQPLFQFSNRVAVHFDAEGVTANFPESPRANAEAGLNQWCGQLLGAPQRIVFTASLDTPAGPPTELTLESLKIQPLDLVCLAANTSELEVRAAFAYRRKLGLADDVNVNLLFSESRIPNTRPLSDVLPVALMLQRIITSARPLTAQDYLPDGVMDTPSIVEVAEYRQRIESIAHDLEQVLSAIKNTKLSQTLDLQEDDARLSTLDDVFGALKKIKHDTTADDWLPRVFPNAASLQNLLIQLSSYGVAEAFPRKVEAANPASIVDLIRQAAAVVETSTQLLVEVRAGLADLPVVSDAPLNHVESLMQLGKKILGGSMPLLPHFRYINAPQIAESNSRRGELLTGVPTDPTPPGMKTEEWLQSAARVRPKLAQWEALRFMTASNPVNSLDLAPIQVPTDALMQRQADGSQKAIYTWVATEFPAGVTLRRDVISVLVTGDGASNTTQLQTGLLLDEWAETIPTGEELTALTFHYNQPNAEAPQSLLLAVCPDGKWTWQAVVNSVTDTLLRAKTRTVDIMQIKKEAAKENSPTIRAVAHMLPMLIAPVNIQQHTYSLDYGMMKKSERDRMTQQSDEGLGHYQIWQE